MTQLKRQAVTLAPNELDFITQFSYCSFDWIYHSKTIHSRIKNLYKGILWIATWIVYNNKSSSFKELFEIE